MKVKVASIVFLLSVGISCAWQVPGLKIPGMGDKSADANAAPAGNANENASTFDKTILEVGLARQKLLSAQLLFADALGFKEKADKILSAANMLVSGGVKKPETPDEINKSINASKELMKMSAEAAEKAKPLDDDSKAKFEEGQKEFSEGLLLEATQIAVITLLSVELVKQADELKNNMNIPQGIKVGAMAVAAGMLAKNLPGDVKSMSEMFKLIQKVGADNNIEVKAPDVDKYLTGAQAAPTGK